MKRKLERNEEGKVVCHESETCPYCGSEDVEYDGGMDLDGDALSYGFTCNECGRQSTEWYKVEYDYTEGDEECEEAKDSDDADKD